MATLTIRNIPDEVRDRIRRQAAQNGRSMEEEVRRALADHFRPKKSFEEVQRILESARAKIPPQPIDAKMDGTEAFLAEKRIDLLFQEGLISLPEKRAWSEKIDRHAVSLPDVQGFFEEKWPWTAKS